MPPICHLIKDRNKTNMLRSLAATGFWQCELRVFFIRKIQMFHNNIENPREKRSRQKCLLFKHKALVQQSLELARALWRAGLQYRAPVLGLVNLLMPKLFFSVLYPASFFFTHLGRKIQVSPLCPRASSVLLTLGIH